MSTDWRCEVLRESDPGEGARLEELRAGTGIDVVDALDAQLAGLRALRPAVPHLAEEEPRWVHYPWRRALVRVLGPAGFRALRLDRNRNKITADEQAALGGLRIGVVGLSVGHTIAYVLAQEGLCGSLRLADFDVIELSNMNRIPASVLDIGLPKTCVLARRILELDPYASLEVLEEGVTPSTVGDFVEGLDLVVEECDSLDVKALVRDAARRRRVPVLMETSDRGLFDVERFDLEPTRPIFHGLLGDVDPASLVGLTTTDKVPHVVRILEAGELSGRMAASMAEIDHSVTTWPQLAGDVTLGGATVAAAVRRFGRGGELPSGRARVDLDAVLDQLATPAPNERLAGVASAALPVPDEEPADPRRRIAHAANRAPSGGNVQPWRLRLLDDRLEISLDPDRTSAMDVRFRGSYVAMGAALLNARVAASRQGLLGPVTFELEPDGTGLTLRLQLGDGADEDLAPLHPAMLARSTNRRPGSPAPLADDLVAGLAGHVAAEGATLHLTTDRATIDEVAQLIAASDRLRYLDPALHAEMMSELRWPSESSVETGIDVRTLELDGADLAKLEVAGRADVMALLERWGGGHALGDVTRDRIRSSSAVAIVTVGGDDPCSYVQGGGAVQRLWVAATAAGLAVQPISPVSVFARSDEDLRSLVRPAAATELRALTERLRAALGLGEQEVMALVLRLSHAEAASTRSLRLAVPH